MERRLFVIITVVCIISISSLINADVFGSQFSKENLTLLSEDIQYHAPIRILNDDDLRNKAIDENWDLTGTRDGSQAKPFVIGNLSINASGERLIWIEGTTLHLIIENNELFSGGHGISLWNTFNISVSNNHIYDNGYSGIDLQGSNTLISNNHIENNQNGLSLFGHQDALIIENEIVRNSWKGIGIENFDNVSIVRNQIYENGEGLEFLMYTRNTLVFDNDIYNNEQCGVFLGDNFLVNITNNRIHHNYRNGIQYEFAFENSIINDNLIFDNGLSGIEIIWAAELTIINNTISKHNQFGILILDEVHNTTILRNFFVENMNYGISLSNSTFCNKMSFNNFINNSKTQNSSQGDDSGSKNNFTCNYWNDWIEPDIDSDNRVDVPYKIDGDSNNSDLYPLCNPSNFTQIDSSSVVPNQTDDTSVLPYQTEYSSIIPYLTYGFLLTDVFLLAFILIFTKRKRSENSKH